MHLHGDAGGSGVETPRIVSVAAHEGGEEVLGSWRLRDEGAFVGQVQHP